MTFIMPSFKFKYQNRQYLRLQAAILISLISFQTQLDGIINPKK